MKQVSYVRVKQTVKTKIESKAKKILVSPYQGCAHDCLFCPANDGFLKKTTFEEYRNNQNIYVIDNIIEHLNNMIAGNTNAKKVVHLSPVSDPLQPAEEVFGLSHSIMQYCTEKNIPIALCTKGCCTGEIIELMKMHQDSFVQISLPTIVPEKHKYIVRGEAADVGSLLLSIESLLKANIVTIVRIDPIFPYITDEIDEFEKTIILLRNLGVRFVLSSVADIIPDALERERDYLEQYEKGLYEKYKRLYSESILGRKHAYIEYRKAIFREQREVCKKYDMSYGITWEQDEKGNNLADSYNYVVPRDREIIARLLN